MKEIKLTQGKVAIVDDSDYEWLKKHKWYALFTRGKWYARRTCRKTGKLRTIPMHREIAGVLEVKGLSIKWMSDNKLDNRRMNLRLSTSEENIFFEPIVIKKIA